MIIACLALKVNHLPFAGNRAILIQNRFGRHTMELNDIYDKDRNLTGQTHRRGAPWRKGEYGLVVCVWVCDGKGKVLLTRRAPEKSYPHTWENSGGAVKAGEHSREAIARELFEETGIRAEPAEFELIATDRDRFCHYDFYRLYREIPIEQIVLQPGETDGVRWATYAQVHEMIEKGMICKVIAKQFVRQEPLLRQRDTL